ncbi:DMT family transporter [Viridibacillus sp. YIM B01967]|uniref:DMT family transporter n=1 Tax=Viridibacillus soli TaxID=2798301 RepID=A0ABS1HE38_9BACL|nr:DMT family transporter [Viridibacillus soli]MBK3497367.1 DMT family transporter [Viridibacillus soli]
MNKNLIYPLLIVLASSSYGILSTIIKVAMQHGFESAEAVTSQYVIGFSLALLLFILTQRKLPSLSKQKLGILIFGGLLTGTTGIVYGKSLDYLPASLAVVMLFQFTWIGMFIDCLLRRRLPKREEVISLIFLFAGTILAAGILDVDLSGIAWQGWVYGFAAAVSFSIFIQINSRPTEGVSTIARMTIMSFFALVLISIFLTPEIVWNGQLFGAGLWKFGLALGLFGIILPILLFTIAVPKVGGGMASILSAMELPVAIIVSVVVLHESLTWVQIAGILLVLFGMTLPALLTRNKEI